jgi:hypothetical protein
MNTTPLTDTERKHLTVLETGIAKSYMALTEVARDMQAIGQLNLYRETHPTFEQYCKLRWGMDPNQLPAIQEVQQVLADVKDVIDLVKISEVELIDQFTGLTQSQRRLLAKEVAELETPLTAKLIYQTKEKLFPEQCLSL